MSSFSNRTRVASSVFVVWAFLVFSGLCVRQTAVHGQDESTGDESRVSAEAANSDSHAQDTDLKARVLQLARQLNADALSDRQAAEESLVDLGPRVLPHLPETSPRMPQELKLRLSRVREVLEKQSAVAATEGSRVTIQGKMLVSQAIRQLQDQTGNRLLDFRGQMGQPATDPEIELDLIDSPFWEAVDTVFQHGKLTTYAYTGQLRSLAYVNMDATATPSIGRASYAGLFRFEPTRIEAVRNLKNPSIQGMRLTIEVTWEPRVPPIALKHGLETIVAIGDNDEQLVVGAQIAELEAGVQSTVGSVEIDLPFDLPSRDIKQIKDFRGEMQALLPGRIVTMTFNDLENASPTVQEQAGVTVTLQGVRQNVDVQEVRILVAFDKASGALESHRGWIYDNEAYIETQSGQRIDYSSFETTRQQESEVGLSYKFALKGKLSEYRFVYKTPAAIVNLPVKYQLTKIPLP